MTSDERVVCNGYKSEGDSQTRFEWDGEYPYYEPTRAGFIVHLNKKSKMAGVFTDKTRAERGYAKYLGKIREADERMKAKKKGK